MELIMTLVILAVLVEAIVEGIKKALVVWDWVSLGLGALVCVLAGVDLFAIMGVPLAVPYVGAALSGLVCGRGASVVYDVWDRIKNPAGAENAE